MTDTMIQEEFSTRCQRVLQFARNLFQSNPDWVTFFREVLGVSGAARKVFSLQADFVAFEKSAEYGQIQQMVTSLRTRKTSGGTQQEPTRVITVRLPESLHEALKAEASDHNTSMNKLCISKLLQVLIEQSQAGQGQPKPAATPTNVAPPNRPVMNPAPSAVSNSNNFGNAAPNPQARPTNPPTRFGQNPERRF